MNKEYKTANSNLDSILELEDNWNNNGASSFSLELIDKAKDIVNKLTKEPYVFPTACGTIQFEYENSKEDYLEFEIYSDKVEVFIRYKNGEEKKYVLSNDSEVEEMNKLIEEFFVN